MSDAIRRRRWTSAEDELLCKHYGTISAAKIGAMINRTETSVWMRARHLSLDKREEVTPWTGAELEELRRCYATDQPREIAKRLGRTPGAISQQAMSLGLVGRKTLITQSTVHDYFCAVTSAEQAYILGLLAADGCIASGHPRVVLGLQAKDASLVEFVRDRLCPAARLSVRPDGYSVLQVTSRQMVSDLARYGIVPRKSRMLMWPPHLGELQRPFLTGYFDGDGSMYLPRDRHGRERPGWTVCSGSERFLVDMKDYIRAVTGVELQKIQHRPGADLWQVSVTGHGAAVLDEFLHRDGVGLERKRFPLRVVARYGVSGEPVRAPACAPGPVLKLLPVTDQKVLF